MEQFFHYFTNGIRSETGKTVGAEVETQFVDNGGVPITLMTSQRMLRHLAENGWIVDSKKRGLLTTLVDKRGNRILFELGRHNLEVATAALAPQHVMAEVTLCLGQLYKAAGAFGAKPYFSPILETDEDLLVVPDDRDATWLELDGRDALTPMARTSSVQFTISVSPEDAIRILNRLGSKLGRFLIDYPQEVVWRTYVAQSRARYRSDRYGGPSQFDDMYDYCRALSQHDVVHGNRLVPLLAIRSLDIPMFVRSVWWYFRLKRFGDDLCIEVRPMSRRSDERIQLQYDFVRDFF